MTTLSTLHVKQHIILMQEENDAWILLFLNRLCTSSKWKLCLFLQIKSSSVRMYWQYQQCFAYRPNVQILISLSLSSFTCLLFPMWQMENCKLDSLLLSSCRIFTEPRSEGLSINSCPANRFSQLICEFLQLLQSYLGPLVCFSD